MELPDKLQEKLKALPDKPGCYLMRDRQGRIIYVGKAVSLRKRVKSYFRDATWRKADPKLRGLLKSVCDLDIVVVRSEAEALLTEGRLIKEYKPRYNVDFRDDKRFIVLRADITAPFPMFQVVRFAREDQARYYGPYVSSSAARATLDFVEKRFGIRKCRPRIPDSETYRHCLNDIVRFCSAPCIGRVSPEEYRQRFEEACAFLSGERPDVLAELSEAMQTAATGQHYEKAAALRDTLLQLRRTIEQRVRMLSTPQMRREDAQAGVLELQQWLGLPAAPTVIEGFDISNISGTYAVASMVCAVNGMPHRNRYRRFRIRTVKGSDDPAMMAEAVRRRYQRLQEEGGDLPGLVLVDGGITQLRAARRELAGLGLDQLPVAGLAKRFEEIYWKEGGAPLVLPADSRALGVLQRLRDEAHRFAITYHRALRSQRIRESVIDEVPGIGAARKKQLLAAFGSVRRLAAATPEQIAEVPGIGYQMAQQILKALNGPDSDGDTD